MKKNHPHRWVINLALLLILVLSFSGCMYPKERMQQNDAPPVQQIQQVQDAVNNYKEKTGVLPIQNREQSTPIYEKYPIDFKKLTPDYLSAIPAAAFENGGRYLFVLINVKEKPEVRLADLTVSQKVQSIQQDVQLFFIRNQRYPLGEKIAEGYYLPDYKALGIQEVSFTSAYSQQKLNVILSEQGAVGVDYTPDIYAAVQKLKNPPGPADDLRKYVADDSPLVPTKSFPYLWVKGEPLLVKQY